jgi:hypothetical protein
VPDLITLNVAEARLKLAVTVRDWFIVTLQASRPEHGPDQPANLDPTDGFAVNATFAPVWKACEHFEPHEMPLGCEVTVPTPAPLRWTVRLFEAAAWSPNAAGESANTRTPTRPSKASRNHPFPMPRW